MRDIQEIFDEIQTLKVEQKEIRNEYKDTLKNANEYEETVEKATELREKKKQIEAVVQGRMGLRYQRFEEVKDKIAELQEMLTDVAMTNLMDGKPIALKDKHDNEYEPVYKITFKKRS
jgi:queuine/archaeosine tRNA-ribosyltransferase